MGNPRLRDHARYSSEAQSTFMSASRNERPATGRHASSFKAALVITGCAISNVTNVATGKCTCRNLCRRLHLANAENAKTHSSTVTGAMTTMDSAHAWAGRSDPVRTTQSADSESPIALALATAYTWNMLTTAGGHDNGKLAAAAEMTALFQAILATTTSTALASPPSATVAKVMPTITARAEATTRATKSADKPGAS